MKKILNIWNSSFSGKLCGGMKPAHFVASSKGINLLKDINNYLYKDKAYNTQVTYRCQKYRNGCKARSCSTKGIQRTGFYSNLFRKQQLFMIANNDATYFGSN